MNIIKKTLVAASLLFVASVASAQQIRPLEHTPHFDSRGYTFFDPEVRWVDSVLNSMSLAQRIAQLMVVRVPLNLTDKQAAEFSQKINGLGVGGVCFFAGTAERQVAISRRLQDDAQVPLLVCIDGEWGLGMRLKDAYSFPRNARFGLLSPDADSIVYRMGEEIGRQCREMGIHVNFAPVVDINSNPKNPVIGTRSFGIDRERVSQLGIMYALGQQSQGVIATAKHFPGHGDTDADSHYELPVIKHTRAYIDSVDTYPFRQLIEAGVEVVMVAHLQVNALDANRPSSLSPVVVDGLLRGELGFDGLVFTDGLDMKGVTNSYGNGRGELAALLAGNDILLLPPDVPQAISAISLAAMENDSIRALVDYHCRRVLKTKYSHVVPFMNEEIHVPGPEHKNVCDDIVRDLNLNIDRCIDSIVDGAIRAHATPGCQIAVMHKGRLVVNRAYGNIMYNPVSARVEPATVYDLASLTKVCATTLAVMKLYDDGKLKLDDRLSKYLPYLKKTDKKDITIKQAMSHCARLKAFDAYWQQTTGYDSILSLVAASPLNDKDGYLYSDLGFMLLSDVVRRISGMPLDEYVMQNFYQPMGLTHTRFNPMSCDTCLFHFAPTEASDRANIGGYIMGVVHDPNAYAMGGVSGHAGLFSTAEEVARLMQMLLNGGELDGRRYLRASTVETFTARHFEKQGNRRALGFDKQLFNPSKSGQTAPEASQASYGHTGFTGTMVWVDPEYDLVFVFLSNRVHPSASPNLLAQMNVRTEIQSVIYHILKK
ncbi:MAG: serine hydrolase [Bacteroidales bacterium]|nr:serine hydrolase [Bacteroidales bacterium]